MNSLNNSLMAISVAVLCGGCAHSITISPDPIKLTPDKSQPKIEKSVGYFISETNKALQVTTPGGGGDSVKYTPYNDLEPGINQVLSNVFSAAHAVKDVKDQAFLQSKNISWIFTPAITTTSSSRNVFFWPPTDFSVSIDCTATDTNQQEVWKTTAKADGDLIAVKAIINDHALAGKSAAANALKLLQTQIQAAPEFRK